MKSRHAWVRGAAWGGAAGAIYHLANLLGTLLSLPQLFDPTPGTAVLLLVAAVGPVVVGMISGALLGGAAAALGRRLRWRPSPLARRAALAVLFVAVTAASFVARRDRALAELEPRPAVTASRPVPVLWLVVDTLRADTLYGADFTLPLAPSLGRFAQAALLFTDAESTAGWTIPSVAALLTGVHNTTMDASAGYLPDWAPTAAERLRAAGYETHAVVDNGVLEVRNGFGAGFESFFLRSGYRFAFTLPGFRLLPVTLRELLREGLPVSYHGVEGVTDVAIDIIERGREAPLFLYVQTMDPHDPYYPHPELGPDPPGSESLSFFHAQQRLQEDPSLTPTPGQLALLRHRYANEVRVLDAGLGRLLGAWQRRFGDESLVVVTSDHGEGFLDHGTLGHGLAAHRELVHVPLLLKLPQAVVPPERARGRVDHPVSLIDLLPTTLEVAGVPAPARADAPAVQGRSWLTWLQGREPAPARPLYSSHSRNTRRTWRYREGDLVYLRTDYYDERPTEIALYDLAGDPTEQRPLALDSRPEGPELAARYSRLAKGLAKAYTPDRPSEAQANEESLRALGYIQ